MKDESIIKLARLACGTGLLIVHALTRVDGILISTALVLLSVPFELVKRKNQEA